MEKVIELLENEIKQEEGYIKAWERNVKKTEEGRKVLEEVSRKKRAYINQLKKAVQILKVRRTMVKRTPVKKKIKKTPVKG